LGQGKTRKYRIGSRVFGKGQGGEGVRKGRMGKGTLKNRLKGVLVDQNAIILSTRLRVTPPSDPELEKKTT